MLTQPEDVTTVPARQSCLMHVLKVTWLLNICAIIGLSHRGDSLHVPFTTAPHLLPPELERLSLSIPQEVLRAVPFTTAPAGGCCLVQVLLCGLSEGSLWHAHSGVQASSDKSGAGPGGLQTAVIVLRLVVARLRQALAHSLLLWPTSLATSPPMTNPHY